MQKKIIPITVCSILAIVFIVFGSCPDGGYSKSSGIMPHFYYMFFHASILHLICNCYSLYLIFNTRIFRVRMLLPLLYVIAVLSSFCSQLECPTVGASALVYAMLGITMAGTKHAKSWVFATVFILFGIFIPGVNSLAHVSAFFMGLLCAFLYLQLKALSDDYRAVNRGK